MAVKYTLVNPEKLVVFATKVFEKLDVPHEDAEISARILVDTDLRGVESHGIAHLGPFYRQRFREGLITPKAVTEMWSDAPATAMMDGGNGLGFVVGHRAMREAIFRASMVGAGFVSVCNSTHFGACSIYALMAAKENYIGISMTTGGRNAVPPGGAGPSIGVNAMSIAVPSGKGFPFCLDMATTVVAHGKVEIAQRRGENIPEGWMVGADGKPLTDPKEESQRHAGMVLMGVDPAHGIYKGFALNVLIDIFSSMLSGSASLPEIYSQPNSTGKGTHFFGALKISGFLPMEQFFPGLEQMYETYHNLPRLKETERILLAGEIEWQKEQDRRRNGIPYDEAVIKTLKDLASEFNLEYDIEQ